MEMDIPFRLQLADRVKAWRGRLIANHLQKNPDQRRHFLQTLYVPMQRGTAASSIYSDQSKSESVFAIPQVLKIGTAKYDYLGGVDGLNPFYPVILGTGAFMEEGRFWNKSSHYDEINNYIIVDNAFLKNIRVSALFDDPAKVFELECALNNADCDAWNKDYPMSAELTQLVIQSILQIDYNRKDPQGETEIEVSKPKQ